MNEKKRAAGIITSISGLGEGGSRFSKENLFKRGANAWRPSSARDSGWVPEALKESE